MTRHASVNRPTVQHATSARAAAFDRVTSRIRCQLPLVRFIALSTILASLAVWLNIEIVRAYRQRVIVQTIWSLGGYVQREHDGPTALGVLPSWYRGLLGDDFMNPVTVVRLVGTDTSDDDLASVGKLAHLRMLDLRDTRITDRGLSSIRHLQRLEILTLAGTAVSDRGLAELACMSGLKVLCLDETRITDQGLPQLSTLNLLGWLSLSATSITANGLSHISGCTALEVLIFDPNPVRNERSTDLRRFVPAVQLYDGSRRRPAFHSFYYTHFLMDG